MEGRYIIVLKCQTEILSALSSTLFDFLEFIYMEK